MAKHDPSANGKRLSALDRAVLSAMGDGRSVGADDDPARSAYPLLWEWLSKIYIGSDRVRTPASLTIQLGPGGVLISLSDRDLGVSCGSVCEHLDEALKAMEASLASAVPPIRSWGKKEPRLRKRGG